jgi:hypothetical protein
MLCSFVSGIAVSQVEPIEPKDTDGNGFYEIDCPENFYWMSMNDSSWTWNLELMADIDFAKIRNENSYKKNIGAMANFDKPFTGDINGNGYALENFDCYTNETKHYALFAVMKDNNISDLIIKNPFPMGTHNSTHSTYYYDSLSHAGLAAWAFNSELTSCHVVYSNHNSRYTTDRIDYNLAGLVARAKNCMFKDCTVDLKMQGRFGQHSGLALSIENSEVKNCTGKLELKGYGKGISPFFMFTDSCKISNCHIKCMIDSTEIKGSYYYHHPIKNDGFGGIAASISNGVVSDCSCEINLSATGLSIGGIAGTTENTVFINCNSSLNLSRCTLFIEQTKSFPIFEGVGGISAYAERSRILNCTSTMFSDSTEDYICKYIGGMVGKGRENKVENCSSELNLRASAKAGGIIGYSEQDSITHCSISGRIYGKYLGSAGGIAGFHTTENFNQRLQSGCIAFCKNEADIQGRNYIGGIVGAADNFIIACCENHGEVHAMYTSETTYPGGKYAGGIVGYTGTIEFQVNDREPIYPPTIQNCYNTGNVRARYVAAGIAGGFAESVNHNREMAITTVNYCYNVGNVGFFEDGWRDEPYFAPSGAQTHNSFWDISETGRLLLGGGIGKFTNEMKDVNTYIGAGWDFDNLWKIDPTQNNGYPIFKADIDHYSLDYEFDVFDEEFILFPNPATDYIYIGNIDGRRNIRILVRDITGKIVYNSEDFHDFSLEKLSNPDNAQYTTIKVSNLQKGVYSVEVQLRATTIQKGWFEDNYERNMYKLFIKE